jgi:hypothetical protein
MHHFPLSLLSSFSWSYHHSSAAPMNHWILKAYQQNTVGDMGLCS